jgi:hypothetical protein
MLTSLIRLGYALVLSGLLVLTAAPAVEAGECVLVLFTGVNNNNPTQSFAGYLQYDSSVHGSNYTFSFEGLAQAHQICYYVSTSEHCGGSGATTKNFTIKTNNNLFDLTTTCVQSATSVEIKFNLTSPASPTQLPLSSSFPQTGSITITGPSLSFSGTIQSTQCGNYGSAQVLNCNASLFAVQVHPTGQSPPVVCPPPQDVACCGLSAAAPVLMAPTAACAVPGAVYVCQPRRSCCLSGLFRRRGCL